MQWLFALNFSLVHSQSSDSGQEKVESNNMKQEPKPVSEKPQNKSRKAIDALKNFKGYADVQHFYKSKLKYMQFAEKEIDNSFVLGYN